MSLTYYLPRRLSGNDNTYTEAELLAASSYIIVLAEPGAGKTELMESLAFQLGTSSVTAAVFKHRGATGENCPLVIDAFDELAKIDSAGIYTLLTNATKANPTRIIISSRSSEWDNATTNAFKEFIGYQPLIVRLFEFNETEQQEIFNHHTPDEDFKAFQSEVARFNLEPLLPNPQFLKLFADAYIESDRHFIDKRSIFSQAVDRLAKEANTNVTRSHQVLSTTKKVELSSEVFAKLLLSGSEGVGTSEATEDRMHPLLASLFDHGDRADGILATRLFKPGGSVDQHRPVHKIVAEYCAADYLTKRIADSADSLTLHSSLSIIAPNSTVRDELRGLLGWMATLGNRLIQQAVIELDPYAVLANGDPSQLEHSSKRLLLTQLKEVESKDPYFRRGDYWRRFSVAGFFTQDVLDEIKPLLAVGGEGSLRDLILELLIDSPETQQLQNELQQLTLATEVSEHTRLLANRCLFNVQGHNHRADIAALIAEGTHVSLNIAAEAIEKLNPETFGREGLNAFFRACASLYPSHKQRLEGTVGRRYFVRSFIAGLNLPAITWLLDELTKGLACQCGKKPYECDCRNGISKIVGFMLDRYFELAASPHDSKRIWQWVKNLNFNEPKTTTGSKAVKVLQEDDVLRKKIMTHVFEQLTDRKQIIEAKQRHYLNSHSHSGLIFLANDSRFIIDLAFQTDNPNLWASFILGHDYYRAKDKRGPDSMRHYMRQQAFQKPLFMREWAKTNRATEQSSKEYRVHDVRHERRMKLRSRQKNSIRAENIKYIQENREFVESGRDWGCLDRFAHLVLHSPDRIELEFGDEVLVRNALRSCIDFITPAVPSLFKLAELQCASEALYVERVLFAACLEIMRVNGNLENINIRLLKALKTNLHTGYSAVASEERDALQAEVDRLVFPDATSAYNFLREYLEPQLAQSGCANPEIWLLGSEEVFSDFRASLSIEWLRRFRGVPLSPLDTLFNIAARYGNRNELKKVILNRCAEFICCCPTSTNSDTYEQMRTFWFMRAWYFLETPPQACWDWLKNDRNTVLTLHELSGSMNRGDRPYWPQLTSGKVEAILYAFINKWPKVDLPSHWGTSSPIEEKAYRFLTDAIWSINSDEPGAAIPVLDRLIADPIFSDLHNSLKSIRLSQIRNKALRDFEPPTPQETVDLLDHGEIVTVEGLRQHIIHELLDLQKAINGGEFNPVDRFYEKGERLGEEASTEIIAERLNLRLELQGISVTLEHQLKSEKRSDFTATKIIRGKRRLLVAEVKGQWHRELYTAASAQLHELYSIHPDAEQQGIYLVIWFGENEKVAGRISHSIKSAQELKNSIEATLPQELKGLIDVFVLDVSKPQ